jgi:hypothetical protein
LATGVRDLWPDGIGNDSSSYQPDSMLTILLAERTGKSPEEIVQNISDKRSALISAYQEDNSQLTASSSSLAVSSLSPKQKSDLRANITKNLKSEFLELNPDFVWPQESDMFFRLAQENFPGMSVIVHGGAADRNQGRATGVTGLKKVAVDLIEEVARRQPSSEISLAVIAGSGHAPRFSAILRDEIKAAGNSKDILDATEIFTFYPVGPSPDRDSFAASNNNVGQNLLNFIEANLGAINHELNRVKPKTSIKQNSSKTLQEENNFYCVIA